ncbi:MAG TPA: protein kinase, partial [Polyangia bacterium]
MNPDHFVRPGQRLGKYILGEPIARGGMAEVWAARVEGPQGFVKSLALKFILESFTGDSDLERLFVNEARLAAQLQHANLVGVYDFDKMSAEGGRDTGRYYIAMERVDGHDLRRLLQNLYKRGRLLPLELALHIAGEVLKGLRYVHERRDRDTQKPMGLVHRDVSPHNILIGMGGEVKLSDFGIAKAMTQSLGTQAGMIRGKLAYASPEQLRSDPLDHRTDQFALGVTLWEALAGRRLFEGGAEMEIIGKVLRCHVPLLPIDVGVAPPTEAIVRRMLAANAVDRFGSTAEALSAVVAAPGYTADGAALEALMREVFAPQNLELPPTLPLDAQLDAQRAGAAPARVKGQTETSALARGADPILDPLTADPASVGHTWRARPSGDGVPVARPVDGRPPDSSTFPEKERSVTGSAYVSTADELPLIPRARPAVRALSLVGALALGGGAIVIAARHPWSAPGVRPRTASAFRPAASPAEPSPL